MTTTYRHPAAPANALPVTITRRVVVNGARGHGKLNGTVASYAVKGAALGRTFNTRDEAVAALTAAGYIVVG